MTDLQLPERKTLAERTVDRITARLSRRPVSRRRFLARTTVAASALAVDPVRYVLRPGSAYASVCGASSSCGGGWTAFCCTINDGANTCPPGSYAAGWWKVDQSSFCKGAPRYYIDCNRLPSASCSCTCADGACDQRKVCCNVFRYGQCHLEVPGVTEVVCRVITCTVPWEWDEACSDTVRTDNRTATHSSSCLPGTNASWIEITYQDMGLVGSFLGKRTSSERDTPRNGRRTNYQHGAILWSAATGAHAIGAAIRDRLDASGGVDGSLGFPTGDVRDLGDGRGRGASFERGAVWSTSATGAHAVVGQIHDHYQRNGGPTGWLGYPTTEIQSRPGPWRRIATDEGWQVVHQTEKGQTRVFAADVELPEDGSWPPSVDVVRWSGPDRVATAVGVADRMWPDGADTAVVASARDFADAMAGGVAAARLEGPLLLTEPDRVPDVLTEGLDRLGVRRIVLLGGTAAVSRGVADALRRQVGRLDRWAGDDRYATAVEVSRQTFSKRSEVVHVATGRQFADALAAVPAAAAAEGPILLVDTDHVPDVVVEELKRLSPRRAVVLGGRNAVSRGVAARLRELVPDVSRVGGSDRYGTAANLSASWVGDRDVDSVFVVDGTAFPDGLSAGAAAAVRGVPVLLSDPSRIPDASWSEFRRLAPQRVVLVGGTSALSENVRRHFDAAPVDGDGRQQQRLGAGAAVTPR